MDTFKRNGKNPEKCGSKSGDTQKRYATYAKTQLCHTFT